MTDGPLGEEQEPGRPRVLQVVKGLDLGGLERVVVDLSNGLARTGFDVELAVLNSNRAAMRSLIGPGIVVHVLGTTDRPSVRAALRLGRLLRSGKFDIVHAHGPLPAILVRVLTPRSTRVVTTSHTTWKQLRRGSRLGWRLTAWRDDAIVCVSEAVAAGLPARPREPVVIPHGVDAKALATVRRTRPDRRDVSEPLRLITVASHRDVKNYPNLLRAVRYAIDQGTNVRLTCIGDGPGLDAHRDLSSELGLGASGIVQFRPAHLGVHQDIVNADVLVVASDFEGQPLVVAEALALGIPVIATAVGRVPELVTNDVGRIVPPGNPVALGSAIVGLTTSQLTYETLRDCARAQRRSWTVDDAVRFQASVYRPLLESAISS